MKPFLLLALVMPMAAQLRINAGGAAYTDILGGQWRADKYFVGGAVSTGAVPPNSSQFYVSKRYGDFFYALPVPDGSYLISLYFLENVVTAVGQRVFNVSINGAVVMNAFDPILSPGAMIPFKQSFPVTAANGAGIKIQFATVTRSAFVNAIEVSALPDRASVLAALNISTGPGLEVVDTGTQLLISAPLFTRNCIPQALDTSWTIPQAQHGRTDTGLSVAVYDDQAPRNSVATGWVVDPDTLAVTVGPFPSPMAGCVVIQ